MINMDIYDRKIGLPDDWTFEDCLSVVSSLSALNHDLYKKKHDAERESKKNSQSPKSRNKHSFGR